MKKDYKAVILRKGKFESFDSYLKLRILLSLILLRYISEVIKRHLLSSGIQIVKPKLKMSDWHFLNLIVFNPKFLKLLSQNFRVTFIVRFRAYGKTEKCYEFV